VRRGNGNGTFGPPTDYPVGLDPWWVTADDIRHNGKVDLFVANGTRWLTVSALGNGDGTFQPAVTY